MKCVVVKHSQFEQEEGEKEEVIVLKNRPC